MQYDAGKDPSAEIEKVCGGAAPVAAAAAPAGVSAAAAGDSKFYESDSIKKMPDWIRCGCGDKPYYCEEKKATFGGKEGITP